MTESMPEKRADAIVNCLAMGMTFSEAKSISPEEYSALIAAWNRKYEGNDDA